MQLLHWPEVSTEAELVVFSIVLAIQHLHGRADGEWTPASVCPVNQMNRGPSCDV